MLKKIIVLAVIMVCGINVLADYVSDRKTDYQIVMPDKYPAPEIGERLKRVVLLIQAEFKSKPMDRF